MKRKCYESYDYIDPNNLYTYPDSSVLRNKQEERDEQKARDLEYRMVASKSLKLFINPIPVYSVEDILKIHQFLFDLKICIIGQVNLEKSIFQRVAMLLCRFNLLTQRLFTLII